jgi:hypothetical protein
MAFQTHIHVRKAMRRSDLADLVSSERPTREARDSVERDRLTDTHVWNWAESAVLSGYGPGTSSFL